ncbi:MAG TPA: FAD-dependent monooxygenase [Actinoallomurus sp.]|nr:FAD-dependent monooxygenase [Actinoallomurus sp.]
MFLACELRAYGVRTGRAGAPVRDRRGALDPARRLASSTALVFAPQQRIEEVLEKRAVELGVEVRRGHAVLGLEQDDCRVTVAVEGPGGAYDLRAEWLVGCDGGRSTVRNARQAPSAGCGDAPITRPARP